MPDFILFNNNGDVKRLLMMFLKFSMCYIENSVYKFYSAKIFTEFALNNFSMIFFAFLLFLLI